MVMRRKRVPAAGAEAMSEQRSVAGLSWRATERDHAETTARRYGWCEHQACDREAHAEDIEDQQQRQAKAIAGRTTADMNNGLERRAT